MELKPNTIKHGQFRCKCLEGTAKFILDAGTVLKIKNGGELVLDHTSSRDTFVCIDVHLLSFDDS